MSTAAHLHVIPQKILCPTDFSPAAASALEVASDFAQHLHAGLILAHIVPLLPTVSGADFFRENDVFRALHRNAAKRLEEIAAGLEERGIQVETTVVDSDDVAGELVRMIEAHRVDMIVISTHGMTGWRPLIFGSVAEKMVKLSQCPVLLLRAPASDQKGGIKS